MNKMYPNNGASLEYREGVERWFAANMRGTITAALDVPKELQREMLENRARNEQGLCFRSDCGQPLSSDVACPEHSAHATERERLEARASRLGITNPKRRIRRYY